MVYAFSPFFSLSRFLSFPSLSLLSDYYPLYCFPSILILFCTNTVLPSVILLHRRTGCGSCRKTCPWCAAIVRLTRTALSLRAGRCGTKGHSACKPEHTATSQLRTIDLIAWLLNFNLSLVHSDGAVVGTEPQLADAVRIARWLGCTVVRVGSTDVITDGTTCIVSFSPALCLFRCYFLLPASVLLLLCSVCMQLARCCEGSVDRATCWRA